MLECVINWGKGLQCPELLLEAPKSLTGQEVSVRDPASSSPFPSSQQPPPPPSLSPSVVWSSPSSSTFFPFCPLPSAPSFLLHRNPLQFSVSSPSLPPTPDFPLPFPPPSYFSFLHPLLTPQSSFVPSLPPLSELRGKGAGTQTSRNVLSCCY